MESSSARPTPIQPPPHALTPSTRLYLSAHTTIRASARLVHGLITDLARYPEWNSFVPAAEVVASSAAFMEDGIVGAKGSGGADPKKALAEGDLVLLHVRMKSASRLTDAKVKVREISTPSNPGECTATNGTASSNTGEVYRLAWAGIGMPPSFLSAYRVMEVRQLSTSTAGSGASEELCELRTWETMEGPVAYIVKMLYGKLLQTRFEEFAADLKKYAEGTRQAAEAVHL